ncbi:uncharacterized protein LOC116338185 isoform X2 [Contarinia nasturtii]|nr:uncharacterized protein LOC116338185 isoform X2 [Contarinia nasturtii]
MFDVIATAKNTQWLSFPTLNSTYSYSHVANDAVDFQVIPSKNCFVEFNKKFGFELLRTINIDGKDAIQRIKKRKVDDVSCGAIAKVNGEEIALGMTTGFIRLFNVTSGEFLPHKFKPDRVGNSVIGLDYSNTDEYLAAVYDSADINLYGLKTGIRTDTFKLSGISTLVRFHPARKFALAVGSYEGAITMLDIQTKKKLFYEKTAHDAPIRDISMYDSQDLFVSCGFDCNINVFDLRKRLKVQQYKQPHPMSTVCLSPCGMFCVAGNLKGDVISYDFRSMKEPLDTKRVHDSTVVRVAFIPSLGTVPNLLPEQTENFSMSESPMYVSARSQRSGSRDSFAKFVDLCHYNNVATAEASTPKRRDSWADLMPVNKIHDFSMDSLADTPCRMSYGNRSELRLIRTPRVSLEPSIAPKIEAVEQTDAGVKVIVTDFDGAQKRGIADSQLENRKPLGMHNSKQRSTFLESFGGHIQNTITSKSTIEVQNASNALSTPTTALSNVRMNMGMGRKRRSTFHESFFTDIKNTNTSSPSKSTDENAPNIVGREAKTVSGTDARKMLGEIIDRNVDATRLRMSSSLEKAKNEIIAYTTEQADKTYNDIHKVLEHFYQLGLQGGFNLMSTLPERCDLLEKALIDLIKTDPLALEYFRMKYTIIDLKEKLGIREPDFFQHLN